MSKEIDYDLYENIPEEIKALDQHVVAAPDKSPWSVNGKRASTTDPSTWSPFDLALNAARAWGTRPGLVITEHDDFCLIDIDIKDKNSLKDGKPIHPSEYTNPKLLKIYEAIARECNSYMELSQSGIGLHIIVIAKADKGHKRDGVEFYPHGRYGICTGNSVSSIRWELGADGVVNPIASPGKLPIRDCQEVIDILVSEMSTEKAVAEPHASLVELPEKQSDEEIMQSILKVDGNTKARALLTKPFQEIQKLYSYPSRSEADMAALGFLANLSNSNEQCRRIFRKTPLGDRYKVASKNRYLDLTLRKIRLNQAFYDNHVLNGRQIALQLKKSLESKSSTHSLPVDVAESNDGEMLEWPPGRLGDIAKHIFASSYIPQQNISIATALALIAGVVGRSYLTPTNLDCALYILVIGKSGIGKEIIHQAILRILMQSAALNAKQFARQDRFVSGAAIHKEILRNPGFVAIQSEFGRTLIELSNPRNTPIREYGVILTEIFGKRYLSGRKYSVMEENLEGVEWPAVSVIGESTPDTYYQSLTSELLENGFLSRFATVIASNYRPKRNSTIEARMPEHLMSQWNSIVNRALEVQNQFNEEKMVRVAFDSDAAREKSDEFEEFCRSKINDNTDEGIRQAYNRAHLKVVKVSSLLAITDDPISPSISDIHVEWAITLIKRDIDSYTIRYDAGEIGDDDSVRHKIVINVVKKYFGGSYPLKPKDEKLREAGVISRAFIMNRTTQKCFISHPSGHAAVLDATLRSVRNNGLLTYIDNETAKNQLSFAGICFRIQSAEVYL